MAFCVNPADRGNFTFGQAVSGFLTSPGLPFVDILSEQRIAGVFKKHNGLFGRTYTTAIVLWAFISQVLRDGKEASCQSAVARISSYLTGHALGDYDPDTRDYCRARAKLPEDALHELTTEVANETERLVEPQHLWKGRHAKCLATNRNPYPPNPELAAVIGLLRCAQQAYDSILFDANIWVSSSAEATRRENYLSPNTAGQKSLHSRCGCDTVATSRGDGTCGARTRKSPRTKRFNPARITKLFSV